jgi:FAD/FMN-containing dehydrogenase
MTARVKEAGYKMLKACVELGGTISGEHGIGIDKREAMKWLFSRETLLLFRRLKNAFDPDNLCNPDKLIPLISKQQLGAPSGEVVQIEREVAESVEGAETPTEEKGMLELLQKYAIDKTMFGVQGAGTKHKVRETRVIKMTSLNRVLDFDRGNLSLTIQAGVSAAEARATVEKEGQYLWVAGEGTIGGILATGASVAPPLRDLILGMRVALPTGEVVNLGAKTMKNVAGYDAAKLLLGSWGTLGIILDVTFRLFPYAAPELRAVKPQPFVLRPLHKKIKLAFDPYGIMAPRTAGLSTENIAALGKKGAAAPEAKGPDLSEEEKVFKKLEDKFWV